jgi:RND family efflux transporter MFP subunit
MKVWLNRFVILALFAGLVTALLWFQGLILRPAHATTPIPALPALGSGQRTARVELRATTRTQAQPGFVEAVDSAHIAARVMANVLEVSAREGETVEAGRVLVRLDDRDAQARLAQARAAHEAARAQALAAQLAFERVVRLVDGAAATTQELEGATAAKDGARAAQERAAQAVSEAEAALSWFEVRAPFDGRVLSRSVEPGQLAAPGQPLLSLYRGDQLRVAFAIPAEHAAQFAVGAACSFEIDGEPTRDATVERVLPTTDAATGTVMLRVTPSNSEGLRPGQLARLEIAVGAREALLAPAAAIERIGQIERVRLVQNGRVSTVIVSTGKRHGEFVEVLSGLRAGEEIVTP